VDEEADDRSRQQEQKSMLKVLSVGYVPVVGEVSDSLRSCMLIVLDRSDVFDATMARSPYPGVGF